MSAHSTAIGGDPVPGHPGQDHPHAAGVRDPGDDRPRIHKVRQPEECLADERPQSRPEHKVVPIAKDKG